MFALELSSEAIGGLQVVALAVVAGYVALRTRKIDTEQLRARRTMRAEKARCDALEARVVELEALLKRIGTVRRRK